MPDRNPTVPGGTGAGTGMPLAHHSVTGVPRLGEADGLDAVALGTGVPLALALATE